MVDIAIILGILIIIILSIIIIFAKPGMRVMEILSRNQQALFEQNKEIHNKLVSLHKALVEYVLATTHPKEDNGHIMNEILEEWHIRNSIALYDAQVHPETSESAAAEPNPGTLKPWDELSHKERMELVRRGIKKADYEAGLRS